MSLTSRRVAMTSAFQGKAGGDQLDGRMNGQ